MSRVLLALIAACSAGCMTRLQTFESKTPLAADEVTLVGKVEFVPPLEPADAPWVFFGDDVFNNLQLSFSEGPDTSPWRYAIVPPNKTFAIVVPRKTFHLRAIQLYRGGVYQAGWANHPKFMVCLTERKFDLANAQGVVYAGRIVCIHERETPRQVLFVDDLKAQEREIVERVGTDEILSSFRPSP